MGRFRKVLVPSTGNLYIYFFDQFVRFHYEHVLVPSTGNLYIYYDSAEVASVMRAFSSPPRGIYISTNTQEISCWPPTKSSRPLHGESIYLHEIQRCPPGRFTFSSPPRGIYISTSGIPWLYAARWIFVLVPSTGNLYIYYLFTLWKNWYFCSRPLHGESIYLRFTIRSYKSHNSVLVPSTGNLYIYSITIW